MLKTRLIPVLILREGLLVQSILFSRYLAVGLPLAAIEYFNAWAVDELIFINIDRQREDLTPLLDNLGLVNKVCFMPLTVGGGIRRQEDVRTLLAAGADKVTVNTEAFRRPEFISEAASIFGQQCIVVSIDARKTGPGAWEVMIDGGREATGISPDHWARRAAELGAGEILLNSVDRDGTKQGYDQDLIRRVVDEVQIPVIALGGVGRWEHLVEGVERAGASAVAAANIFHYTELSTVKAKQHMYRAGLNVRYDDLAQQMRINPEGHYSILTYKQQGDKPSPEDK